MTFWLVAFLFLGFFGGIAYIYLIWNFNYWKKRGINGPKPKPFIGTFPKTMLKNSNLIYDQTDLYRRFKSTNKFIGVYTIREPELMILCPNLVRDVFVKYFKNFHDNAVGNWINHDKEKIIGRSPFLLTGDTWKEVRSQIVPSLTTNKIKSWYNVTQTACQKLTEYITAINNENSSINHKSINTRNLALQFTVYITTNTIFGIESNSLNAFSKTKKTFIMEANDKFVDEFVNGFQLLSYANIIPFFTKFFNVRFLSDSTENFFKTLLKDSIKTRLENSNYRNDFLDTLIQLEKSKNLTLDELVAHALTFTLDGYDTTATTISHCLLLLGRNKNAQHKLRLEILNNIEENQCLSFEKLNDMQYLDQCINETLRIFPPIAFSLKRCTETLTLENYNGNKIIIKPGQTVHLPLYAIYHDPNFYHEPEEFIPERFDPELGGVKKFKEDGKFFPFGDGPRICPGMKFGLSQSKAAIVEIVKKFSIDVDERTRTDNKIGSISLAALLKGKILLKFKEL